MAFDVSNIQQSENGTEPQTRRKDRVEVGEKWSEKGGSYREAVCRGLMYDLMPSKIP